MLKKLTSLWIYGNRYAGIEITTLNGSDYFYITAARKRKGEFESLEFFSGSSLSEAAKKLTKHQHAYLSINTDQVLIKEIPIEKESLRALSVAFPGISPEDFYYEIFPSKEKTFVSICRKEIVEQYLEKADDLKLEIVGFCLGFSALEKLIPQCNETQIQTSRQSLSIRDNDIIGFSNSKEGIETFTIGDVAVTYQYLISLSCLFFYISERPILSNSKDRNSALKTLQAEKVFFRKGFLIGLALLLSISLLNVFYFTNYRSEFQQLQEASELATIHQENLSKKRLELDKKERITNNLLQSGNSKSSFYINRIVQSLPKSIVLSELTYHPLEKNIRPDKPIEYTINTISIAGESGDKEAFSAWVEQLERFQWLKNVTVLDYGAESSKLDHFRMNLILSDDTKE